MNHSSLVSYCALRPATLSLAHDRRNLPECEGSLSAQVLVSHLEITKSLRKDRIECGLGSSFNNGHCWFCAALKPVKHCRSSGLRIEWMISRGRVPRLLISERRADGPRYRKVVEVDHNRVDNAFGGFEVK